MKYVCCVVCVYSEIKMKRSESPPSGHFRFVSVYVSGLLHVIFDIKIGFISPRIQNNLSYAVQLENHIEALLVCWVIIGSRRFHIYTFCVSKYKPYKAYVMLLYWSIKKSSVLLC